MRGVFCWLLGHHWVFLQMLDYDRELLRCRDCFGLLVVDPR